MTTRLLPSSEWAKLAGTELETVWPHMDPSKDAVLVVEKDGQIKGCWARIQSDHLEGLTIRGGAGVARALLAGMSELVGSERPVFTSANDEKVEQMIRHFGGHELPGRHFVLRMA